MTNILQRSKITGTPVLKSTGIFIFTIVSVFLLFSAPVFAAYKPQAGKVDPSSGYSEPGKAAEFTTVFLDQDGSSDIYYVHFLVAPSCSGKNALLAYYNQSTNLLYLLNEAGTGWYGGFAPGSSNIINHPYCKLDCSKTTITRYPKYLVVKWSVIFKSNFTGAKNTYLYVKDKSGLGSGWIKKGTWSVTNAPKTGTLSPTSGSSDTDKPASFTANYSDVDGASDMRYLGLLVNTAVSGNNCLCAYYDQTLNKIYLRNDGSTSWLGGFAPGSSNTIENSYAKVDCLNTTVLKSGTNITINWSVSFKSSFLGAKNTYLWVRDVSNAQDGWIQKGTWAVNAAPEASSVALSTAGTGTGQTFTFKAAYKDMDGYANIITADILVEGDPISGKNCFWGRYKPDVNKVYLRDDQSTAWLGGFTPGSSNSIENSYVKINCSKTTVQGSSDTLTVNWAVTFKPAFYGTRNIHTNVVDKVYSKTGWVKQGTCDIIDPASGGTVDTGDGDATVTIPGGAVTNPTPISIEVIDHEQFEEEAPADYTPIVAVKCEPDGIQFSQPLELTIKLATQQVPGTEIDLGLLNASTNKVDLTGQKATVGTDGMTIKFNLTHFSNYVGLGNMTSQGAPIGGGVKIPLPDLLTGAYSNAVNIVVPEGRLKIQPNIMLKYNSSNGNSWVGYGWELNPGSIVRSSKLGVPSYDDSKDVFVFSVGDSSLELVHLVDNLYEAKIESDFTRFYKETDGSWRAVLKSGVVLKFGTTAESRETSSKGTLIWMITKLSDANGNYVSFSYTKDDGKSYLSRIAYTGNDNANFSPTHFVDFYLEGRTDISSSYLSGAKIGLNQRLSRIDVSIGSQLVWRYQLNYQYAKETSRSLLKSVIRYTSDGKEFPAQTFYYQTHDRQVQ